MVHKLYRCQVEGWQSGRYFQGEEFAQGPLQWGYPILFGMVGLVSGNCLFDVSLTIPQLCKSIFVS